MFRQLFVLTVLVGTLFVATTSVAQPAPAAPAAAAAPSPGDLTYTVESRREPLDVSGNFPDAIKVTAKTAAGAAVPNVRIKALVRKGDALLYAPGKTADKKLILKTSTDGVAAFSIVTNDDEEVEVQLTPLTADETKEDAFADKVAMVSLSSNPSRITSLGSKRSYLQLFLGQTFTNNYKADPDSTKGETINVGFGNAGPLIRLTFDTMWPRVPRPGTNAAHSLRHGLWHTDANLEFSRFPFGDTAAKTEEENNQKGLRDAFSGSLGMTWQPNRWASYDLRAKEDRIPGDNKPFDAYRFGAFGKAGVTTRYRSEPGGNNSVNRVQFGIRFTHSRSDNDGPAAEDRNEIPIRFVELSYARFSDWGRQDSASRLVIDGGLRITALSNRVFPIYVGGHLNTGPGEDDLRVFIGMLVKLDVLGKLVQQAGE